MENDLYQLYIFVVMFGTFIAILAISLQYGAKKMEHRVLMKALELNRDIPALDFKHRRAFLADLRFGVFSFATSAGLYLTGMVLENREAMAVALLPLCIGLGFIVMSIVVSLVERDGGQVDQQNES